MLPIVLSDDEVRNLMHRAQEEGDYTLTIDLETQTITDVSGLSIAFSVAQFQRYCLLEGLDDIGLTLCHEAAIKAYEATHANRW
jgi:3-isopropylmalate/(R)-2-methylmalate dehydratase small subunit